MHLHDYLTEEFIDHSLSMKALKKRSVGGFLSRALAGGAVGGFLFALFLSLMESAVIGTTLIETFMIVCGLVGAMSGGLIWLSRRIVKREVGYLAGAVIGISLNGLLVAVVTGLEGGHWEYLPFVWSTFVGLTAGVFAVSRIRPWQAIAFGSNFRNGVLPKRSAWSLLGIGLRLGSLLLLIEAIVDLELNVVAGWHPYPLTGLFMIFYCAVSVLVSFSQLRFPIVVAEAVFINMPLLLVAMNPPEELSFLPLWSLVFLVLWLLFIFGRLCAQFGGVELTHFYPHRPVLPSRPRTLNRAHS